MTPFQKDACRCSTEAGPARSAADNLLGDFSALLQQIGLRGISPAIDASPIEPAEHLALPALTEFLETYCAQVLLPVELPAIVAAARHASRGETRELIALDQQLAAETRLAPFASASRKIGSMQLHRMKPLRDERTVQRYLTAVEAGQAGGWHTLVYGLTLAVFSFPLRQGLLHYGRETLSGLALAAGGSKNFLEPKFQEILGRILARLPEAVERAMPAVSGDELRLTAQ
jgi:urease accessory protein UreF